MSVDLRKRIVDLGQKAAFAANQRGIEGQRARVARVPDGRPRRTRADGDDCRKWADPDRQLAGCYPRGGRRATGERSHWVGESGRGGIR
jgi:hypothetical protein